ncbi:GNAT family N-acetyltransferase [Umezawaea endophytica]|uniref:GNAT family N-acetyltransferase n=1 Tax=Umezawaea endophytica TaxID=1654476 RepID=A0A9X3AI20_9PSEU|nr:GNAT family N-acetyltransferase [Umezawaea endophytica]MCS7480045.1 GNAT family N-acetyltransferase [Umezawaea endophytica]
MTPPDEVHTERLRLRRVVAEDLPAALAIMSDPETNHHNPDGTPTPERTAVQLAEWLRHWAEDGIGYWAVELRGRVIGFGGLRTYGLDGEPTLNLFYRFTPAHWGFGYATEMADAAITWATSARPDRPVVILTGLDNKPSQRVAEKLGFVRTGTTDHDTMHVYRRVHDSTIVT